MFCWNANEVYHGMFVLKLFVIQCEIKLNAVVMILTEAKGIHIDQKKYHPRIKNNDQTAIEMVIPTWQFVMFFVRFFDGC